ncbi:MAG: hypothetical protein ACLQGT_03320 [Terracidiphilus sp.]
MFANKPVLEAIYFDNEGHVIHHGVTPPSPAFNISSYKLLDGVM